MAGMMELNYAYNFIWEKSTSLRHVFSHLGNGLLLIIQAFINVYVV